MFLDSLENSLLAWCDFFDDGKTLFVEPRSHVEMVSQAINKSEEERAKIVSELQNRGLQVAKINKGGGKPYQILAAPPSFSLFSESGLNAIGKSNPRLARSLEPVAIEAGEGKLVTIVSMINNRCKHSNVPPKRGLRDAPDWTGYDYLQSWRLDGVNPSNEYYTLLDLLYDEYVVPDYEYSLVRPDDGAILRYSTSYTLVNDFYGERVRFGISDPNAFSLVEAGRSDRIIK
jgi:hypothetical protein